MCLPACSLSTNQGEGENQLRATPVLTTWMEVRLLWRQTLMPTKPDFKGAPPHFMASKVRDASADGIGVRGIERNRDSIPNDDHGGAHSSQKDHRSHPVSNAGPQGLLGSPRPESEEQQSGINLTGHLQQTLQSSKAPDTQPSDTGRGD